MNQLQYELLGKFFLALKGMASFSLRHGSCIGADEQAVILAYSLGIQCISHQGDNLSKTSGQALGLSSIRLTAKDNLERNRDIVNSSALIFGTPSQTYNKRRSGTWMTLRYSDKCHLPRVIIFPDGSINSHAVQNLPFADIITAAPGGSRHVDMHLMS